MFRNHPSNLLRDSGHLLAKSNTNFAAPSQYKSDTKLFQSRPPANNTYGDYPISSKVLLFANQPQSRHATDAAASSSSQNLPMIRRPTSVKYRRPGAAPVGSNIDPLLGSSRPPRGRSDSMQNPATVYRSDFDINGDQQQMRKMKSPNGKPSGRAISNENRLAVQYGVKTSENPLYGAHEYQSQVCTSSRCLFLISLLHVLFISVTGKISVAAN